MKIMQAFGETTAAAGLRGIRVALLIAPAYADEQLWVPRYRLIEAGAEVIVVGTQITALPSLRGAPAEVQRSFDAADATDFDGAVIPGGAAPDERRELPPMVDFARALHDEGRVIAAIERGVLVLRAAGLVAGRRVTGCASIRDELRAAGARWVDQEVASDGPLITSRRSEDLPAFCRALVDALDGAAR